MSSDDEKLLPKRSLRLALRELSVAQHCQLLSNLPVIELLAFAQQRHLLAVAGGRRAWRRAGRLGAEAPRQGGYQALLPAGTALLPDTAKDRRRPTAQLRYREGQHAGAGQCQPRVNASARVNNRAENSH